MPIRHWWLIKEHYDTATAECTSALVHAQRATFHFHRFKGRYWYTHNSIWPWRSSHIKSHNSILGRGAAPPSNLNPPSAHKTEPTSAETSTPWTWDELWERKQKSGGYPMSSPWKNLTTLCPNTHTLSLPSTVFIPVFFSLTLWPPN